MYFFDPEGNRIEVYYKTGVPVPQPHGDPIDLARSDEELLADAKELLFTKRTHSELALSRIESCTEIDHGIGQ